MLLDISRIKFVIILEIFLRNEIFHTNFQCKKEIKKMLIKTDGFELEISKGGEIYLGSLKKGQTFLKWSDVDESIKSELENIIEKAKNLILDSENLLLNQCQ